VREVLGGTTVPPLQIPLAVRPSGLLIPAGAVPMPLDRRKHLRDLS